MSNLYVWPDINFALDAEVSDTRIEFKAWSLAFGVEPAEVFVIDDNSSETFRVEDRASAAPELAWSIKWDGCADYDFNLHTCSVGDWRAVAILVERSFAIAAAQFKGKWADMWADEFVELPDAPR